MYSSTVNLGVLHSVYMHRMYGGIHIPTIAVPSLAMYTTYIPWLQFLGFTVYTYKVGQILKHLHTSRCIHRWRRICYTAAKII